MKRLLMTSIASLMIAGAFSLPAVAEQGGQHGRGGYSSHQGSAHNDRGDRNRNHNHDRNDHRYDNRYNHRYDNNRNWGADRRYDNRYWGANQRWDRHDWRRGDRLGDWNRRYHDVDYRDYRAYRLYDPPYGYRWVRDDNGDFLLAALAGGLIAAIIANN
jgi:Ni/Co efflux regulator RcnB